MGWNFSVRSQATEEWESSGKFFCLFFTRGCGGSTGGSSGAPNKRSLPGTPTESQGARFSRSLCLHLIPFIIYSPPHSTKHCTGSKAAPEGWRCTADPCLSGRRGPKIAEPEDGPLRIVSIQPHNSTAARVARSPLYTGGQEIQRAKVGGRPSQPSPSSLHQAIPPVIVILKQMNNYGSQHL